MCSWLLHRRFFFSYTHTPLSPRRPFHVSPSSYFSLFFLPSQIDTDHVRLHTQEDRVQFLTFCESLPVCPCPVFGALVRVVLWSFTFGFKWTDVPVRRVEQKPAASACSLQPNQRFLKFHAPHCFQGDNEAQSENNETVDVSEWSGWFSVVLAQEYLKQRHHCGSHTGIGRFFVLKAKLNLLWAKNPQSIQTAEECDAELNNGGMVTFSELCRQEKFITLTPRVTPVNHIPPPTSAH